MLNRILAFVFISCVGFIAEGFLFDIEGKKRNYEKKIEEY